MSQKSFAIKGKFKLATLVQEGRFRAQSETTNGQLNFAAGDPLRSCFGIKVALPA